LRPARLDIGGKQPTNAMQDSRMAVDAGFDRLRHPFSQAFKMPALILGSQVAGDFYRHRREQQAGNQGDDR
jgi:hypothetical protein